MSDDPRERIRQLLLSGDNVIKNRTEPTRRERARERYLRAREIAVTEQLDPRLIALIDARLLNLAGVSGAEPDPAIPTSVPIAGVLAQQASDSVDPAGMILGEGMDAQHVTLSSDAMEFELFAGLSREQVIALTRGLTAVAVRAGEEIDLATNGSACSIVWSGRLALVYMTEGGGQRTVSLVEEGDVLVSPPTTSAQVGPDMRCRALASSVVVGLTADHLERWLQTPGLATNLLRILSAQIADRELAVAIALEGRVERRLLLKLRQLALRWGRVTPNGIRLDLRLTHQELADMVGAVRESVTLAFGRLTKQGEIEVIDRAILIPTDRLTDPAQPKPTTDSAKRP